MPSTIKLSPPLLDSIGYCRGPEKYPLNTPTTVRYRPKRTHFPHAHCPQKWGLSFWYPIQDEFDWKGFLFFFCFSPYNFRKTVLSHKILLLWRINRFFFNSKIETLLCCKISIFLKKGKQNGYSSENFIFFLIYYLL